jgi:beta-lactamase superfamily II metal-dependent hydrolase
VLNPKQPLEFDDANADSIALRLQVGNTSVLFAADTLIESEKSMLSLGLILQSQVLKVGHHGRDDSTSEEFLDAVDPAVAVISADDADDAVLDKLDTKGVTIYTTYDDGTVVLSLNTAPTSYASPTPAVAEYPAIVAVPVVMAAVFAAVLLCKKQYKQRSCA